MLEWLPGVAVKWIVQTSNHKMQNGSPLLNAYTNMCPGWGRWARFAWQDRHVGFILKLVWRGFPPYPWEPGIEAAATKLPLCFK